MYTIKNHMFLSVKDTIKLHLNHTYFVKNSRTMFYRNFNLHNFKEFTS